jgi:hypothetical protein
LLRRFFRTREGVLGRSFEGRFFRAMKACSGGNRRFLHNRAVLRASVVSLLAAAVLALAATSSARPIVYVTFQLPSKNIGCAYATGFGPVFIRCDIRSGLKPEPRRACELDWTGVSMGTSKAGPTCAGDTVLDPRAPVLGYGKTWKRGPFTCLSSRVGLSCANRAGAGFFLSRETWRVG